MLIRTALRWWIGMRLIRWGFCALPNGKLKFELADALAGWSTAAVTKMREQRAADLARLHAQQIWRRGA